MSHLLDIQHFHLSLQNGEEILKDVSLVIQPGQSVGLFGDSGSGKSILGLSLMGLLPEGAKSQGKILFQGENLLENNNFEGTRGSKIAMVFQEPMTSLNPIMNVLEQVAEGIIRHEQVSKTVAQEKAMDLLREVGLPLDSQIRPPFPHELSGGQRQRVVLAMALACRPQLLIADEPTTALDLIIQQQILELISVIQKKYHMALLFITHDLSLIRQYTEVAYQMVAGHLEHLGPSSRLTVPVETRLEAKSLSSFQAEEVLRVENLSQTYIMRSSFLRRQHKQVTALDGVSFSVKKGKTLGVVGESGSGKSTLGQTLLKLIEPTDGRIFFKGQDLARLKKSEVLAFRKQMQIIFQDPMASLNPRKSIAKALIEPMEVHGIGSSYDERFKKAKKLMQIVGLSEEQLNRYPSEFSGGQRQRICIARALSVEPEFIVCDESVSALDKSHQLQILNLLKELQSSMGISYVFISHDLSVVRQMADDVLVLKQGKVVESGPCERVYNHPQEEYTQQLMAAMID